MSTAKERARWYRPVARHWAANPITFCEARFPGCFGTHGLSPAHSKDRDEIQNAKEMGEVIAACKFCHDTLDQKMSKDDRLNVVREVIANRDYFQAA